MLINKVHKFEMHTLHILVTALVLTDLECAASSNGIHMHISGPTKIIVCNKVIECAEADGFFQAPSSEACFKAFPDQLGTWAEMDSICKEAGLVLAEPEPEVVAYLQSFLHEKYGDMHFWLNGQGTGRSMQWVRGESPVDPESRNWWPGEPQHRVTKDHCLYLTTWDWDMRQQPGRPYRAWDCSGTDTAPLCERLA